MPRVSREGHCEVPGCELPIYAKRICRAHYARQLRTGSVHSKNPPGWGTIQKHPLHSQWVSLLAKAREGVPIHPAWDDNIVQFTKDVGLPPSPDHRLWPRDRDRPLAPDNFEWVKKLLTYLPGETHREYQARSFQERKARDPDGVRRAALKTRFGVTPEQFDEIWEKQGRACAICREDESVIRKGKKSRAALDHDWLTHTIRGILCTRCNRGIGFLQHDIARLEGAIVYLKNPTVSIQMPPSAGRYHKVRGPGATRSEREKQAAKIEKEQKK